MKRGSTQKRGLDAFVTCDKAMETQQSLGNRPFAILVLSTNHFPSLEPNADTIARAVETAKTGDVTKVECGRFVPRKFRKPMV
jgi:hypothetical protein